MADSHGVQTSNTDYAYFNPLPGSFGQNIGGQIPDNQVVSSGPQVVTANPFRAPVQEEYINSTKFDNPTERTGTLLTQEDQEAGGANVGPQNPEVPDAVYYGDKDNPGVNEDRGDIESNLIGEGLGDAGAGVRQGTITNPSVG